MFGEHIVLESGGYKLWCVRSLKILTKRQRFVQLVAKTLAVTHATWVHSTLHYLPLCDTSNF